MIHRSILSCVLCLLAVSQARAAEQADTLEQLRRSYQQARETAAKIEKPTLGSVGFRDDLKVWADAARQRLEAAQSLVPALLMRWTTVADGSEELAAIQQEIKDVYRDMSGKPMTQASNNAKSFFADAVWPLLSNGELSQERAAILVELTKPHAGIRMNDKIAQLERPTEPLGWNIQDTYSLALLRAARVDDARRENKLLLDKLSINLERGRLPDLKVNYRDGKRSQASLRREYLIHRSLIEALAQQEGRAKEFLMEANAIEEENAAITREQEKMIREIESQIDL